MDQYPQYQGFANQIPSNQGFMSQPFPNAGFANQQPQNPSFVNQYPQDRGIMNHIPFGHHQQQQQQQHPLAPLCNPQMDTIILQIRDVGHKTDGLVAPSGITAYTVNYRTKDSNGSIRRNDHEVGSWKCHTFRHNKLEFKFPWCDSWGFHPEEDRWLSDAGLLPNHEFEFVTLDIDRRHSHFTLKCVDVSDPQRREICQVVMERYETGTISIPLQIVGNQDQLDELVTVATAVMDYTRDNGSDSN